MQLLCCAPPALPQITPKYKLQAYPYRTHDYDLIERMPGYLQVGCERSGLAGVRGMGIAGAEGGVIVVGCCGGARGGGGE